MARNKAPTNIPQQAGINKHRQVVGNEISQLDQNCRKLLNIITAIAPVFRYPELTELTTVNGVAVNSRGIDVTYVRSLGQRIVADREDYNARLYTIYIRNTSTALSGDMNGDDLMRQIDIAEAYRQWMVSFNTVVIGNIKTLFQYLDPFLDDVRKSNINFDELERLAQDE